MPSPDGASLRRSGGRVKLGQTFGGQKRAGGSRFEFDHAVGAVAPGDDVEVGAVGGGPATDVGRGRRLHGADAIGQRLADQRLERRSRFTGADAREVQDIAGAARHLALAVDQEQEAVRLDGLGDMDRLAIAVGEFGRLGGLDLGERHAASREGGDAARTEWA